MKSNTILTAASAILLSLTLCNCGGGSSDDATTDDNTTTASLTKGAELYNNDCTNCHGAQGTDSASGVAKPLNTLSAEVLMEELVAYKNGTLDLYHYGNIMNGQLSEYSDQDIQDVAAYIETFK